MHCYYNEIASGLMSLFEQISLSEAVIGSIFISFIGADVSISREVSVV
jgi:hypothetical protein